MFFPEPVVKIRAFCTASARDKLVEALYDFGVIHVSDARTFSASKPLEHFRVLSERLIVLRALASRLGLSAAVGVRSRPLDAVLSDYERLGVSDLFGWLKAAEESEHTVSELEERRARLKPFRRLELDASVLSSPRLGFAYFAPGARFSWGALKGVAYESTSVSDNGSHFVFLAYDVRNAERVQKALASAVAVFEVPHVSGTFAHAWDQLELQVQAAHAELAAVNRRVEWFVQHKGRAFSELLARVEAETLKAELPTKFGQSAMLCAAEGWVPTKRYDYLRESLDARLGSGVLLEQIPTSEKAPTKLDNPRPIRPFEFLVKSLSLPDYHELDPTILVFISFPIFFGMILGDVGYGLAMVGLSYLLRRKFKSGFFRSIAGMMMLSGIWTVAWGFIFGEFFGAETILGYPMQALIHRLEPEGILHLMQLSLAFGFIHLAVGFIVGAYVAFRENHLKHMAAKISWLLMMMSIMAYLALTAHIDGLALFTVYGAALPSGVWLGLIVVSLVGLLLTEGANALVELPGVVGNVVSYLRIMALGIVGVVLAGMVNQIPLKPSLDPAGLVAFVLFTVAFVLGQVFCLTLGIFESSIQSLRLHYVEFFSKFYHGGGRAFVPLREEPVKK